MYNVLGDLTVVEGASFIAAPSCGLYMSQLGARVIRFDMIGGGPDFHRWPQAPNGSSLYWEGLNKGKESIAIDLTQAQGRELAINLVTASGAGNGIFLTNFPPSGFLSYDHLCRRRSDLIALRVTGHPGGAPAVDYTVNCGVGIPNITGPASYGDEPINHVLPAWDLTTGAYAAFCLLAAERHRRSSGRGQEIFIALSDVAGSTLGHLGQIAEVLISGADRQRFGNDLFGAFGRDFVTRDARRVMLVAITARQWSGLITALKIRPQIELLENNLAVSFALDESLRFVHREPLNAIVSAAVSGFDFEQLRAAFAAEGGVCWGPYQGLLQALREDKNLSPDNPIFALVDHPSGYNYLTPGAAASFTGLPRNPPVRAPRLGEHTDRILADYLGMSAGLIGELHDRKIVQQQP